MSECDISIKSFINKKWFSTWCFSNSSKSVPRQRTLPVLFSTKPMHTSSGGAFTVCSELYHYLQLSQKCPKFLFGFPGNPVNTRVSGKKEYPAVADKQYLYHKSYPHVPGIPKAPYLFYLPFFLKLSKYQLHCSYTDIRDFLCYFLL